MEQWLMIQGCVALNTQKKHMTLKAPSGECRRLNYILEERRNRRYCCDTETNTMIDMESDHGSLTFTHTPESDSQKEKEKEISVHSQTPNGSQQIVGTTSQLEETHTELEKRLMKNHSAAGAKEKSATREGLTVTPQESATKTAADDTRKTE